MKSTICLSMIVKNEAHCIFKCLESVKSIIDYYVICIDSNNTDNTEEIIKNILKDIPGEIHYDDWNNFAHNRNLSLNSAKNKTEYTLIMDADDYLINNNSFNLNQLVYSIELQDNAINYNRPQLFKNTIDCKYVGVAHEYLEIPPGIHTTLLTDCKIIVGSNGFRNQDPNKHLKVAQIFEQDLINNPDNSRSTFYCAQSYRDANLPEQALNYYNKRTNQIGWIEETYCAHLEAAKIIEKLKPFDISTVESAYIKAYNFLPTRAESLMYLACYCRKNHMLDKAYFYAKVGINIPMPSGLFVEYNIYDWRMKDELAVAAFWTNKKHEAKLLNLELLNEGKLPVTEIDRIKKNLEFCNM